MRKDFQKLVEKVVQSLDWDTIFEVHKVFHFGVGEGSEVIPGLKRKVFSDNLTKNDVKNELKFLLRFVVNNDIHRFSYGQWMIIWFNQDWEMPNEDEELDEEFEDDIEEFIPESRLEVFYAPQRIALTLRAAPIVISPAEEIENATLKQMLDSALSKEDYELARKVQDLIDHTKTDIKTDK